MTEFTKMKVKVTILRVSHKEDSLDWLGEKHSCKLKVFSKVLMV